MWWELEEEGYRVTITPNREDNKLRRLQQIGGNAWNKEAEHWSLKDLTVLAPQILQSYSGMTNESVMEV